MGGKTDKEESGRSKKRRGDLESDDQGREGGRRRGRGFFSCGASLDWLRLACVWVAAEVGQEIRGGHQVLPQCPQVGQRECADTKRPVAAADTDEGRGGI